MGKNKLRRFAELETMERVFQPGTSHENTDFELKGLWVQRVFKNQNPLVLELGCGRGEYTVNMAKRFPDRNFIGIDKKGARLGRGAKTSNEENILNTAFLRIQITQLLLFFSPKEISEIWITFPDPQPQKTRENTRMTSARFMEMYKLLLGTNGYVHLKTDNLVLFDYTLEIIKEFNVTIHHCTDDLYASGIVNEVLAIKTTYEKIYLEKGLKICYLSFSFQ
ncbi:MAG: tRNA (guanosine(46)-N7)-methyltransferase TrmB [Bacteroidetes bacterium]|nr:tRNA (guanosine(46)-N7)-methyltransferase TrmB [Bacteroidota bacterium]